MGYFYGCLAALSWGLKPPTITRLKTNSITIQLGTGIGVLLFAIIVFFATYNQSVTDLTSSLGGKIILLSFLSGFSWSLGQYFQFFCYKYMSTSIGFCASTAATLLSNAIVSVALFNDWSTPFQLGLGISALFVIIIGAFFTVYKQNNTNESESNTKSHKAIILGSIFALISGILFAIYSALPRYVTNQIAGTSIILPHGIGTFAGSIFVLIIYYINEYNHHRKDSSYKVQNIFNMKLVLSLIPGLLSSIANLLLIYANADVGSAIGFSLTQMSVIVSSLVSLFVLKEYKNKTKKQSTMIVIGSLIILIGGIMIGFTKM